MHFILRGPTRARDANHFRLFNRHGTPPPPLRGSGGLRPRFSACTSKQSGRARNEYLLLYCEDKAVCENIYDNRKAV